MNNTTTVDLTSPSEATAVACTSCTKVIASQCGATLASVSTSILASPVTGATNYRFEVTKGATVLTYETGTNRSFILSTNFPTIASYGTTYSIRVAVKIAGVWDDYGASCNVSTPATPGTTNVVTGQCGVTLANVTTNIFVNEVFQATMYRYEVTNGLNVATIDSPNRYFALSQIPSTAYNTTYSIRATALFNGNWLAYGSACNVTTPNSNLVTNIIASQCGITMPTTSIDIFANEVFGSTAYRFEVTNGATVRFVDSPTRNFRLNQLTGVVDFGTTYSIRVAVKFGGVWQAYGPSCTITLPPLTSLIVSQCGATLASVTTPIWARQMPSATSYRFQVIKGANVATYETVNRYFTLSAIKGYPAYGTSYGIKAAYKLNGSWVPFGSSCTVTTPATPGLTKVIDSQCGATLASISTPIWANEIYAATSYRFEVTNGATVNTIETTNRYFLLSQLPAITYGTTYAIRVAYKFSNVWKSFGASCNVSTPANVNTTKLIDGQCGKTLSSLTAQVLANEVYLATDYRFEVTDGANVRTFDTNVRYFYFSQLTGGGAANTTYSIRVAVKFGGVWQAFGSACSLTTPAAVISRMSAPNLSSTAFTAKAFPNPYSSHFTIAIESASDEAVQVKVYDMIGRQLQERKASVSELNTMELGNDYPVGVYNVIVSQGNEVKSIRMIKR